MGLALKSNVRIRRTRKLEITLKAQLMRNRTPIILGLPIAILIGVTLISNLAILFGASETITTETDKLRSAPVALVLGCPPTVAKDRPNSFFESRMDAASALYQSGKVQQMFTGGV